jgi:hypothetical protein
MLYVVCKISIIILCREVKKGVRAGSACQLINTQNGDGVPMKAEYSSKLISPSADVVIRFIISFTSFFVYSWSGKRFYGKSRWHVR